MEQFFGIFRDVVIRHGGRITDEREFSGKRFACAVMEVPAQIKKDDEIMGGMALWADQTTIQLRHYHLRLVCTNGLVRPQEQDQIGFREGQEGEFWDQLEHMIQLKIPKEVQADAVRFQQASKVPARGRFFEKISYSLFSALAKALDLSKKERIEVIQDLLRLPSRSAEQTTAFEWINQMTAAARETEDPRLRWALMNLGGKLLEIFGSPHFRFQEYLDRLWRHSTRTRDEFERYKDAFQV